jgi:outer membrane receptor protein involved in Fe transport
MKNFHLMSASILAILMASPALAQSAPATLSDDATDEIIVTAQRQAQNLQEVPIAVSAFSAEALDKRQIENSSDLQLSLPNVTFTKGQFQDSSFNIRGIGDLCVGVACDSATAIHLDGTPLLATRLFETEFFDLERVEVLRGPQGTLFGRNATSGVVNFVPLRPNLSSFNGSGDIEYGNYNSLKMKGMINVPITDNLGIRAAGFFLKRDGYTRNLFDGNRIDDRDMYAVRGSLRWMPTNNTTVDLMAYYFREDDSRMRVQKQMCQRDNTGVLGCLPNAREYGTINGNSTFVGTLGSRELLAIAGIPVPELALGSIYGNDVYSKTINPSDPRVVSTDYTPRYLTSEEQYQARAAHDFGDINLQLTGFYHKSSVDSSQDYNLAVQDRAVFATGLTTLAALASSGPLSSYLRPLYDALTPNGPNGPLCTSLPETTGTGSFGGFKTCSETPQDFDRSNQVTRDWSVEGILSSKFDGKFNFLFGGIYVDYKIHETSYYINQFGIDYVAGLLGSFASAQLGLAPSYRASPYYRNKGGDLRLKSHGIFGEAYYEVNDDAKLTIGIRYNNDKKSVRARTTLADFLVPYGSTDAFTSPYLFNPALPYDADPGKLGNQLFQERSVGFEKMTGRAVFDWKVSDENLFYVSYSRGYKSGGFNPPLSPIFTVAEAFKAETVNAFEIGSKNEFLNGKLVLNATAFYYQYQGLQLSRIVARTAVNDNIDADIYGLELEGIIRPTRDLAINFGASYLHTRAGDSGDRLFDPRDPAAGRADAVIVKDLETAANCVVQSTTGNGAAANGFVTAVNSALGLRAPTSFGANSGVNGTGAFGMCGILRAAAAGNIGLAGAPLAPLQPLLDSFGGMAISNGVPINVKGNRLPQAPSYKVSAGVQYTLETSNRLTIVPRADVTYAGKMYGTIFNRNVDKIKGYAQVNAQIQLNGRDDKWFIRSFVQNLFNNNAVTGLYVNDASAGIYTNVFTLEPRRYGLAAGLKF